jgi:hypothetical protein
MPRYSLRFRGALALLAGLCISLALNAQSVREIGSHFCPAPITSMSWRRAPEIIQYRFSCSDREVIKNTFA